MRWAVVALVLGSAVVGGASPAQAIMRRHDVEDAAYVVDAGEYAAVADLLAPGDCLATLIAPRWALSAAHCVQHLKRDQRLTFGDETVAVAGTICHRGFDGQRHDIALVHLAEPVTGVTPIPIYRGDDELGREVLFVGRGDTGTGLDGQAGATLDGQTRRATNTVIEVNGRWLRFTFDAPGTPGATALEGISGDGDSGGPAFVMTTDGLAVAGLSSFQDAPGRSLGKYGVTEVYTRVSRYQDFVDEATGAAWDGRYQRCICAASAGGGPPARAPAAWLAAAVWLSLRRRRRARAAGQVGGAKS